MRPDVLLDAFFSTPITQVNTKAWRAALKQAGMEDSADTAFGIPRRAGTLKGGTTSNLLQALGAWRGPEMVQRYAHFGTEHLERYADRYAEQARLQPLSASDDLATLAGLRLQ